jgi:hypothetical protein
MSFIRRHRWWFAGGAAVFAGLVAFVLLYFAPQDLFIQTRVDEPVPAARETTVPDPAGSPTVGQSPPPAMTKVLGSGRFRSGEHDTSGTAKLLRLADGRRFVRLESLSTSNGPAVRIWLSAAPAGASDDAVDGAAHLDLGGLKANHGNQNYRVRSAASLAKYQSVVIWCDRFDVVFGSAPITG